MNQRILIAILVVVIIILTGTTVYFATVNKENQPIEPVTKVVQQSEPTSAVQQSTQQTTKTTDQKTKPTDETASWKTYSNTKAGFELKYPQNWSVKEHFGKSEEFGEDTDFNDSYIILKKNDGSFIVLGVGKTEKDYVGSPRGIGVGDFVAVDKFSVAGQEIQRYFFDEGNDSGTSVWFENPVSGGSTFAIDGHDLFIAVDFSDTGKKFTKQSIMDSPVMLEAEKIIASFKFTN
jgi:hypothetical protein